MDPSTRPNPTAAVGSGQQHIIVMRHGHRLDNFDVSWMGKAERPWDPPLYVDGFTKASDVGAQLRRLQLPIHRVFVSPFLRCVQTAAQVVAALCAVDDSSGGIDPSTVKVSMEYGICEMLNNDAIRPSVAPKDGKFDFNISELEAMLPAGTVDNSVSPIFQELPPWGEFDARSRYENVIQALADKYPSENLLLVTHGEGVATFASSLKHARVYNVDYCAYAHARIHNSLGKSSWHAFENFELLGIGPDEDSIGFISS